jgi:hypothetical protein
MGGGLDRHGRDLDVFLGAYRGPSRSCRFLPPTTSMQHSLEFILPDRTVTVTGDSRNGFTVVVAVSDKTIACHTGLSYTLVGGVARKATSAPLVS